MPVTKETLESYRQFYHDQLMGDCVPFWMRSDLIDRKHGGYITSVDREGRSYNNDKSVWFQGRCLCTFSALINRYGPREEWLEAARVGKEFMEKYCTDTDGRMFFTVTAEGKPLRKRRYMYSESFYVMSMAEYGLATGDKEALRKAEERYELMLKLFRTPEKDPFKITPKSYTETRSDRACAVPMVLLSCAQLLRRCDPAKADYYTKVTREVVDVIMRYHYKPEYRCVLECVGPDGGKIDTPAGRCINPGHSIENSWFLMNEAIYSNDKVLLEKALNILNWSLEIGWDEEFGGILYFADVDKRPCEQLEWDMKLWWVHNEALIATLMAYGLTKDEKYFKWFERLHVYSFGRFADKEHGEWYGYLHRDGTVSHTQKGSLWKGPFHLPRCLMNCEALLQQISEGKALKPIL
ncbi:N-acylglucosamine 2-epimerase [Trypanosoma rangeli]|uniref:N-acylglucosamine 2-epimerase n=1 Tax=Trypanosoma rangeli TaxID=5698 RepID=A0A422MR06_TRYRA|nr:N-acylglucosamine 2-epimerase [Trypanosoma rangeli]RNE95639.1 N-acylglucosamine 2-epimerase [Trypanosoma rangeli]|eukprot:RNE95639.1 N-acylglucosamine 2-epimerase [Trypanosoma rangeli]